MKGLNYMKDTSEGDSNISPRRVEWQATQLDKKTRALLPLFTGTIFMGAALLFLMQPMIAKSLLPLLGGSPSVWNTCIVFFQALLLAGYLYAHLLGRIRTIHRQIWLRFQQNSII